MIRIVVADDHEVVRRGVRKLLNSGRAGRCAARRRTPTTPWCRRSYIPQSDPSRQLFAAVEAVARHSRFVTPSLSDAYATHQGRRGANGDGPLLLTAREREVVQLLAQGQPNRTVASTLGISVKTVESHRANVMRKLELGSIVDLVRYAVRNRLVEA